MPRGGGALKRVEVAVLGAGAMGARHARVVARDPRSRLVAIVDPHPERARAVADSVGAAAHLHVPDGVEAVIVATPTHTHVEVAGAHLAAGRWALVEKPLAASAEAADALVHPRCVAAHVERFNPAVRAAGAMRPRHLDARRLVPYVPRADDVCVVRDLMVHDLDLLLHWVDDPIVRVEARGVAVRSAEIDVAHATLHTRDGVVAHLLASRVAAVPERMVRVYEARATTFLDLLTRTARRRAGPIPPLDGRDGLTAQWDAFVDAVLGLAPPAVDARDGVRALELAERIRAVMQRGDRELERSGRAPLRT